MNGTIPDSSRSWYVIHTKPRQEERAYNNLLAWQVEPFLPKIKERRLNPYTGAATDLAKPLFPGYIFARFNSHSLLHKVRFVRGVHGVLSNAGRPLPVEDEVVTLIQLRLDKNGFLKIDRNFRLNDKVVVKYGPLEGLTGIFRGETSEAKRVIILLETVSYQARIVVEQDMIRSLH